MSQRGSALYLIIVMCIRTSLVRLINLNFLSLRNSIRKSICVGYFHKYTKFILSACTRSPSILKRIYFQNARVLLT